MPARPSLRRESSQALDERFNAGDEAGEFIGAIFFVPGNEISHTPRKD